MAVPARRLERAKPGRCGPALPSRGGRRRCCLERRLEVGSAPEPCATVARGSRSAVLLSRYLTWSGVRVGRCWSNNATAPLTMAVACEVPLPRKNRFAESPVTSPSGCPRSEYEPGVRRDTTFPGAMRSARRVSVPSLVNVAGRCRRRQLFGAEVVVGSNGDYVGVAGRHGVRGAGSVVPGGDHDHDPRSPGWSTA